MAVRGRETEDYGMAVLIGLVALMYFTVGIIFVWFVTNPENIERMKRRWEQRRLYRRRLRGQATGQEVLGGNYCEENEDETQEEIDQEFRGPKSDIDKKTD